MKNKFKRFIAGVVAGIVTFMNIDITSLAYTNNSDGGWDTRYKVYEYISGDKFDDGANWFGRENDNLLKLMPSEGTWLNGAQVDERLDNLNRLPEYADDDWCSLSSLGSADITVYTNEMDTVEWFGEGFGDTEGIANGKTLYDGSDAEISSEDAWNNVQDFFYNGYEEGDNKLKTPYNSVFGYAITFFNLFYGMQCKYMSQTMNDALNSAFDYIGINKCSAYHHLVELSGDDADNSYYPNMVYTMVGIGATGNTTSYAVICMVDPNTSGENKKFKYMVGTVEQIHDSLDNLHILTFDSNVLLFPATTYKNHCSITVQIPSGNTYVYNSNDGNGMEVNIIRQRVNSLLFKVDTSNEEGQKCIKTNDAMFNTIVTTIENNEKRYDIFLRTGIFYLNFDSTDRGADAWEVVGTAIPVAKKDNDKVVLSVDKILGGRRFIMDTALVTNDIDQVYTETWDSTNVVNFDSKYDAIRLTGYLGRFDMSAEFGAMGEDGSGYGLEFKDNFNGATDEFSYWAKTCLSYMVSNAVSTKGNHGVDIIPFADDKLQRFLGLSYKSRIGELAENMSLADNATNRLNQLDPLYRKNPDCSPYEILQLFIVMRAYHYYSSENLIASVDGQDLAVVNNCAAAFKYNDKLYVTFLPMSGSSLLFTEDDWNSNTINDKFSQDLKDLKAEGAEFISLDNMLDTMLTDVQQFSIYSLMDHYENILDSRDRTKSRVVYPADLGSSISYDFTNASNIAPNGMSLYDYTKASVEEIREDAFINQLRAQVLPYSDTYATYILYQTVYNKSDTDSLELYNVYNEKMQQLQDQDYVAIHNESNGKDDNGNILLSPSEFYISDDNAVLPASIDILNGNILALTRTRNDGMSQYDVMEALYNIYIGFEICNNSEWGYDVGWTVDTLSDMLDVWDKTFSQNYNECDFQGVSDLVEQGDYDLTRSYMMIRALIKLKVLVDDWGIDVQSWSETIKGYYDLAESAMKYYSNPNIFGNIQTPVTIENPMAQFFDIDANEMSPDWRKGFALSALYVPMETNVYDASTIVWLEDTDWVSSFYYKYGFYRKALMISTDNSSVINNYISGSVSSTRPATLGDLLNYDRDITLYVDDDFYNSDEIESIIDHLDYTMIQDNINGIEFNKEEQEDDATLLTKLETKYRELMRGASNLDVDTILKDGANKYYSDFMASSVSKFGEDPKDISSLIYDIYLLDQDSIMEHIQDSEYTPTQAFAFVSAIYRYDKLYNCLLSATASSDGAIFKSSKAMPNVANATYREYLTYMNYMMLANLENAMLNDVSSALDLDAPIFTDIFGNIITDSGLVIIPAASNATLCGQRWSPASIGFATLYNKGTIIPKDMGTEDFKEWLTGTVEKPTPVPVSEITGIDDGSGLTTEVIYTEKSKKYYENKLGSGWFYEAGDGYRLQTAVVSSTNGMSTTVQWEVISRNSDYIKQTFFDRIYNDVSFDLYSSSLVNMVMEVLRGCPAEFMDYEKEELNGSADISKAGVTVAFGLEQILKLLTQSSDVGGAGNAVITMPNPAFISGIEYIMLYVYKIVFAICVVGLMINIYLDAVVNRIGISGMLKFVGTVCLVVICIAFVPNVISWSYYSANKTLLNDEAGYISMMNYTKDFDSAEISVAGVTTPETTTALYLKIDDVSIHWWDVVGKVLFTNTYKTVTELYEDQFKNSMLAQQPGVVKKADGLYMDIQDIYDSTTITYSATSSCLSLRNYEKEGNVTSYVSPYYVLLRQFIEDINDYNLSHNISSYTSKVAANGHVITYDVITPYFMSDDFLEAGYDITAMHHLLNTDSGEVRRTNPFGGEDIIAIQSSLWYPTVSVSELFVKENVEKLETYARSWIVNNKDLLGKVPDEVFLKVFSMQLAMEYNRIFRIPAAKSYEILNIDTRDLMRMMTSTAPEVYKNYSLSVSRFIYEEGGIPGCIFAALYAFVAWVSGFIKIALIVALIGLLLINSLGRKVLFHQENKAIEGYILGCGSLALVNYGYALCMKLSMLAARFGFGIILTFILGLAIQILYVLLLLKIVLMLCKDWKNVGHAGFAESFGKIGAGAVYATNFVSNKFHSATNRSYREVNRGRLRRNRRYDRDDELDRYDNGDGIDDTWEDMVARDRRLRGERYFDD